MTSKMHAVTGGFGYSGAVVAAKLIESGTPTITLTNSAPRGPLATNLEARALCFDDPARLAQNLEGVSVLYNTYWVRFNHARFNHRSAVDNTKRLFAAAKHAGVERIVHVSITNPSLDSPLEYFRGKAELEEALRRTGVPHSIVRPAVLFGRRDILVNNIAWFLRHLPAFGIPGRGDYGLQPIHVDDLASLLIEQGASSGTQLIDAVGPEQFTFRELVETLKEILAVRSVVVGVPPWVALWSTRVAGALLGDVVLTREEIRGLMQGLLAVDSAPLGTTKLTDWARAERDDLGRCYSNELARRKHSGVADAPPIAAPEATT